MNKNIEKYLSQYYAKSTVKAYLREISIYLNNTKNAENYTYSDILNYIGLARSRYSNARTIYRMLAAIKIYYQYLCFEQIRKDNPAQAIFLKDKPSKDVQLQDLFSAAELEQLLHYKAERTTCLAQRNKVLMSLLIYQALTPTEAEKLQLQNVDLAEGTIYIASNPKNNSRNLPLKSQQILLFKNYIETARKALLKEQESLFLLVSQCGKKMPAGDITKHIRRYYKNAFLPRKVSARSIRQSVITRLLKEKNDVRIVQAFAGHKYPGATEKYRQNNIEALQIALEIYHPVK